jgi:hypothetical protein
MAMEEVETAILRFATAKDVAVEELDQFRSAVYAALADGFALLGEVSAV